TRTAHRKWFRTFEYGDCGRRDFAGDPGFDCRPDRPASRLHPAGALLSLHLVLRAERFEAQQRSAGRSSIMMILAGDIGGTKTALGVYSPEKGPHTALAEAEFHSMDYPSLESIAKEFLAKTGLTVDRACFGVAGPVLAGRAKVTNLPWTVDQAAIAN